MLINTPSLQAIENRQAKKAGFVFIKAGEAPSKTFGKLSADKPCIVMVAQQLAAWHISVADPTHQQNSVVIGLPGRKHCSNATVAYDAAKNRTLLTIALPQGPGAGKTVLLTVE